MKHGLFRGRKEMRNMKITSANNAKAFQDISVGEMFRDLPLLFTQSSWIIIKDGIFFKLIRKFF